MTDFQPKNMNELDEYLEGLALEEGPLVFSLYKSMIRVGNISAPDILEYVKIAQKRIKVLDEAHMEKWNPSRFTNPPSLPIQQILAPARALPIDQPPTIDGTGISVMMPADPEDAKNLNALLGGFGYYPDGEPVVLPPEAPAEPELTAMQARVAKAKATRAANAALRASQ